MDSFEIDAQRAVFVRSQSEISSQDLGNFSLSSISKLQH